MAIPSNVGHGTVTGRFIDSTGANIEGSITFTPSPKRLLNATADPTPVTILPKPVTVTLNDGAFTQSLVATDDEDNNPHGWTYHVQFKLTGASADSFSIEVPEGATIDLTTVAPVGSGNGTTIIRGTGVPDPATGTDGQVIVLVDRVPVWGDQTGGGGGGVSSWNDLTDKPAVIAAGATQAVARTAIGAGTSSLTLGTTSSTAMAGNTAIPSSAADVGAVPTTRTVAGKALSSNVTLVKGDVGLGNVDNTSDAAKPVSTATQSALSGKANLSHTHDASAINAGTLDSARIPAGSTLTVVYNGTAWPSRPTARTDVIVQWVDFTGSAPVPAGGIENLDLVIQDAGV